MSQSPPNAVVALLTNLGSTFSTAQANTGAGLQGTWPPEGQPRRCVLTSISATPGKVRIGKRGSNDARELPCTDITFNWSYLYDENDPNRPANAKQLAFKGKTFQVLPLEVFNGLHEDNRKRFEYDIERLKGHLSSVNRKSPETVSDAGAELAAILKELESGTSPICDLNIEYRTPEGSKVTYKTEYVLTRVA